MVVGGGWGGSVDAGVLVVKCGGSVYGVKSNRDGGGDGPPFLAQSNS